VEAIHQAGAVHRDLKPGNVLMDRGSRAVVGDLGLACSVSMVNAEPNPGGTPGYIAPEIAAKKLMGEEISGGPMVQRSDVYALGSLAYEMLAGEPAFAGTTVEEILTAQFNGSVIAPSVICPGLDPVFDKPILDALSRLPRDRTSSVTEFWAALEQAYQSACDPSFGRRVVVAEPDATTRRRIAASIREAFPTVSVVCVADGAEALREVAVQPTALLIVEPGLPGPQGLELVATLRGDSRFEPMAIMIVSNEVGPAQWQALRALGADGLVMKPEDPVQLTALARSLFENPRRRRAVA
jgi:CheY-like chemotaxis protein